MKKKLIIANKKFNSRLFIGTGKFSSSRVMAEAINLSGAELVTVALKRIDIEHPDKDDILSHIDKSKILIVPNTSGARNAAEAVKAGEYIKSAGYNWLKLEIHPDPNYLLPDPVETLLAAEKLVKMGFNVLPYVNADPVICKRLEEVGCAAVMPLGSPIGSNQGLQTISMLKIIIEQSNVPVVIDAGIGKPSDAALAIEIGADAVLINTAIAAADNPILMAQAFKLAVESAEKYNDAGADSVRLNAAGSSPLTIFLN
ncbi:MAG TPA: thiazole synthase [bacterium]|nr:thiazole synthase [bacterium]